MSPLHERNNCWPPWKLGAQIGIHGMLQFQFNSGCDGFKLFENEGWLRKIYRKNWTSLGVMHDLEFTCTGLGYIRSDLRESSFDKNSSTYTAYPKTPIYSTCINPSMVDKRVRLAVRHPWRPMKAIIRCPMRGGLVTGRRSAIGKKLSDVKLCFAWFFLTALLHCSAVHCWK